MKVALCTEIIYPSYGVEKRCIEFARRLPKYGYDVTVYTSSSPKHFPDLNVKQVSKPTILNPPKRNYLRCISFWKNLTKALVKDGYDIIDANGHLVLIPCYMASKITGKPIVSTIHDLYLDEWKLMFKGRAAVFGYPFEYVFSKFDYDKTLTLNSAIKRKMIEKMKMRGNIEVVPSGIDISELDRIKYRGKRCDDVILYTGRLVPQKGLTSLMKAFSIVLKRRDATLKLIGEGDERSSLENMAKKLGIEKNVVFIGRIEDHKDVVKEMKKAAMLVLPSKRECFGIVPLEAMACGLPVISTNTEGPRDYIKSGQNGFLTKIDDDKGLAKRMSELLMDKKMRKKFQKSGRKTSERYDWDIIVKRIAEVYKDVVQL